jgi:hypothetical protein
MGSITKINLDLSLIKNDTDDLYGLVLVTYGVSHEYVAAALLPYVVD